jgi:membrane-associated phospholipid phosphatase
VHYPLDVLAGALTGTLIGWAISLLFNKKAGLLTFDNQPTISS